MTVRFFPVSVCVRGDTGIPDRLVIEEINERLRGYSDGPSDRYQLQALSPEQFVAQPAAQDGSQRLEIPPDLSNSIREYLTTSWTPGTVAALNAVAYVGERVAELFSRELRRHSGVVVEIKHGMTKPVTTKKPREPWDPIPRPSSVIPNNNPRRSRKKR